VEQDGFAHFETMEPSTFRPGGCLSVVRLLATDRNDKVDASRVSGSCSVEKPPEETSEYELKGSLLQLWLAVCK
jgi:DNA-binding transcriptional regulator of glucitol operon